MSLKENLTPTSTSLPLHNTLFKKRKPTQSLWKLKQNQLPAESILDPSKKRYSLFPIEHNDIWRMYKKAEASFWTAEEIDMNDDEKHWNKIYGTQILHGNITDWVENSADISHINYVHNFGNENDGSIKQLSIYVNEDDTVDCYANVQPKATSILTSIMQPCVAGKGSEPVSELSMFTVCRMYRSQE